MSSFLKNFIPFAILVVGSFVGLTEFRKLNYKYRKGENLNVFQEQLTKVGMDEGDYQVKSTISIKEEHQKLMKKINLDDWQNIRAPRPGENSKEIQAEYRKKLEEEKKKSSTK